MFKNAILYKVISRDEGLDAEYCLQQAEFIPCVPSQEKSVGWVPPREAHGPMIESIGGQLIMKLMTETKTVPADVINRKTAECCAQIEASTGRKPGKKETRDIKDDIRLALLPHAFSKMAATLVWIDPAAKLLLVDASSQAKADEVVTALVQAMPGLSLSLVNTKVSPTAAMAGWLVSQEAPHGFSVDRECELKASNESKAVVKYGKHRLDINEVKEHIMAGKMPTKLALTWNDRVSFVLTEGMQIKKLAFLDVAFEDSVALAADNFDADVIIATAELCKLIPDLLAALGGELVIEAGGEPLRAGLGVAMAKESADAKAARAKAPDDFAQFLSGDPDPMYEQAVAVVMANKKPSISLVQRHLKIGYNRAARLIEDMEKAGIVGPMDRSGQRAIL